MKLKENKKVTFDDFLHCYQCGGRTLMGVTSLMKKHGLSPDYGDINPAVLAAAAARGSAVHKSIESYNNGEPFVIADVIFDGRVVLSAKEFEADMRAYQSLGINAIASEFLISDNKMVASSIDIIEGTDEDGVVDLCDTKTTSEVHKDALSWQLAIYKYLLERQCKGIKVRDCYCVHIRRGVGRKIPIVPVSEDKVKALFKAEAEGRIYEEEKVEALSVVSPETLSMIVRTDIAIAEAKAKLKQLEESTAMAKDCLYQYMLENNIKELECEGGRIVLKALTTRNGVDSKKLQTDYPEVYQKCIKASEVKGSVTFKSN